MEPRSHLFEVEIAERYGVNAAIFLEHLRFWIHKNTSNKSEEHFREGRWWTWNSTSALTKIFPYWTPRQIRTIIEKLEASGVIVTEKLGGNDRSTWYAFGPENPFDQNVKWNKSHLTKMSNGMTEMSNAFDQNVKCIIGAVDKPVILPVKRDSSQKGLSKRNSTVIQRADCALLKRVGVDPGVAEAIIYEQQTSPEDIRQAISNAVAKEWAAEQDGGSWTREPGYIVETINTAFREKHAVKPSRDFHRMEKFLKPKTIRPIRDMTAKEWEGRRQKLVAQVEAMQT